MKRSGEILIVEDSALQAKRLKRLLEQNGYVAHIAVNGREGLALAKLYRPSLVVSDIIMPVMDGYEMCRTLKNDYDLSYLPVILLTSLSNPHDVFLGLESGADSYVSKPYDPDSLLARIRAVLDNVHLPQEDEVRRDLDVFLSGKRYVISSSRRQILNLLLSTYQDAVEQNQKLREMRGKLVTLNEKLEKLVAERTAALSSEITERKRIEEALASEKERLSVTLRSIADGVVTTSTDGTVILMNRAAEDLTGWPAEYAVGKSVATVVHLKRIEPNGGGHVEMNSILNAAEMLGVDDQIMLRSRDGSERMVDVAGTPVLDQANQTVGMVFVFRDITEKRRMEEELVKAQKLESLGVLAGGIAHDFNNLLTAILGNVSLAKMHVRPDDKGFGRLVEAEKASLRAKDLTQQLLTFSKGGAPVKKMAAINDILKDSARFALRGSNVRCDVAIAKDLWLVEIDEGQISQVIHNLIINADQAMPEGGVIRVVAQNVLLGQDGDQGIPVEPGKYVKVSVMDNGHGIAPENVTKVFDPYFTTKAKGSGLGLATSYSILKNHDGIITVDSEIGRGSTFQVYLPASSTNQEAQERPQEMILRGNGSVLVMDDEEMLRDFVGDLLDYLGYEVGLAADGQETIEAYSKAKEAGKPFDCVLMDLTIPGGMGGKEAIQILLEIDPEVRAIVSSGYSDDPVMADYRRYGFCGVVAKPYDAEQLREVLSKVIRDKGQACSASQIGVPSVPSSIFKAR